MHRIRRPAAGLFELPCFPRYDAGQRRRIAAYLRRHRRAVRGWVRVVLGQGGPDPWETVRARMRNVLLRTDLWSDQVLVLRAVQSLTMLDVQHNCELVWNLGGYTAAPEPEDRPRRRRTPPRRTGRPHHPPRRGRGLIVFDKMANLGYRSSLRRSRRVAPARMHRAVVPGSVAEMARKPVVAGGFFASEPRVLGRLTR